MKIFYALSIIIGIVSLVAATSPSGNNVNKLSTSQSKSASFTSLTHSTEQRKLRQENDKKEIGAFLNARNLIKTFVKLLFGNNEESAATSRQVLSVLVKVLDLLRNSFTQKARNSNSAIRNAVDDASLAALTLAKGVVKSVLNPETGCVQRYMCEASSQATREGREMAYLIAQVGGYASSYLLENQKGAQFNKSYEAARRGRSGEDCAKIYSACNHVDL